MNSLFDNSLFCFVLFLQNTEFIYFVYEMGSKQRLETVTYILKLLENKTKRCTSTYTNHLVKKKL